jgi:DNA invertase Pin-like site-specific DNA recombinase
MASVAGLEAGLISQRTKAALAASKAREVRLGNPRLVSSTAEMARAAGAVHAALTARGIPTPSGTLRLAGRAGVPRPSS